MSKIVLLSCMGFGFGSLAASGVLTVLLAVGLLPRYVGRTHEANHIVLFENMVILGVIFGSVVTFSVPLVEYRIMGVLASGIQSLYGFFAGIFVGTLALAIAEMLDAFPIYFRRTRIRGGLTWILLSIALGKMIGAFIYFYFRLYETTANG